MKNLQWLETIDMTEEEALGIALDDLRKGLGIKVKEETTNVEGDLFVKNLKKALKDENLLKDDVIIASVLNSIIILRGLDYKGINGKTMFECFKYKLPLYTKVLISELLTLSTILNKDIKIVEIKEKNGCCKIITSLPYEMINLNHF